MEKLARVGLNHLKPGSTMPPLTKGKLRVYSMVFCPYAQRPRLLLEAKNIDYETVNITLFQKPDWYLKLHPLGKVPSLHLDDGRVLPESLILCEYLDEVYGSKPLLPADPYQKALERLTIDQFNYTITLFYRTIKNKEEKDDAQNIEKFSKNLTSFESQLSNREFLSGQKPGYSDYMAWPWIERLEIFEDIKGFKVDKSKFPRLTEYIEAMRQQPAVKKTLISREKHLYFMKEFLARRVPDYDVGLD